MTFNDVDLSDIETSSISGSQVTATLANGYALTAAQQAALVNAFSIGSASHSSVTGDGSISWTYSIGDGALDFLGANDVVTLTYTVQVDDGNGGTATQDVTVTVHGTEDGPTITSLTQAATITEIADLGPGENTAAHTASGAVTFNDVDLSDIETSSISGSQVTATLANGYALTAAQQAALVNAFSIGSASHNTVSGDGSIAWKQYSISDSALDFLGAHDQVTLTYTVQTSDGNGGIASQDVTITVHGTEDVPTITSLTQAATITEIADLGPGENTATHTASGAVSFNDVDLSDLETSSISGSQVTATLANGYALTAAQQAALVNAFSIGSASHNTVSGDGSIAWQYSISDGALDFLGANDVVTLTYTVQVDDGNGGTATQDVTVTVHGTEDGPTITSLTQAATITEIADLGPGENTAAHTASGAVTFNDVDLSDIETSSISGSQVTATLANGYALTAAQQAALVNAFSIGSASHNTVSGDGSIAWQYSISDGALDFLGANDIVKLAYTVQVDDGNGGTASQVVTITVHGTEDVPTITSLTQAATITEIADLGPGENTAAHTASGAVTFNDVDLSDIETSSISGSQVTATLANGYALTAAQQAALVNAFSIGSASHNTVSGDGSIAWQYSISDGALDFLGANDIVKLAYTVQVDDGNGGTASQVVTITVHGTEDVPTITSLTQAATITEIADLGPGENTAAHTASGAVTFNDVDLSDIETSSISGSQVTATLANGYALTAAQQAALVNAFSIGSASHNTVSGDGSIAWQYSISDGALDVLGANDIVKLAYTVQVDDGNGGTATQDVTVTVHGTEDVPTITSLTQAATITEIADLGPGENTAAHTAPGAVTFNDVDLSDIETSSISGSQVTATLANGYALTAAQQAALVNAFSIGSASHNTVSGDGSIAWQYSISDGALDFLGANDIVKLAYTVQVDDGNSGTASQVVTITVHGTEDVPTITSLTQAATITEIADLGPGENTAAHTASGAVTFNDVDLSDIETSSISGSQVTATLANGYALTAAQQAALVNAFSIGSASHNTVSGDGSIAWQYSISDGALDFLGANDVVTLTYTVQVDDGNGGKATQDVTVTVHGTEDGPTITSLTQAATITEIADLGPGENTAAHTASGAVTFNDVDLSDIETSSISGSQVTATLANGYALTAAQQAALVNAFSIGSASHSSVTGDGSIAWQYSISDGALDFLGANDIVKLAYTVQVDDGNGGAASQVVTITVHGTEDVPTITSLTQAATITEIADLGPGENTAAHTASGAVTFNDVDLSDIETSSISGSQVTATLANGYALTAAQQAALVNAFSIGSASHNTVSGDGSIAWQYSISDGALDFLGANDIVKLAYTVQVDDGNGGTASQVVTITVHGTEDVPTITSLTQAATITEIADLGPGENTAAHTASGAVTFNDVDLSDIETSSISGSQVTATLANGYALTAAQQAALVNAFSIGSASHNTVSGDGSFAGQ